MTELLNRLFTSCCGVLLLGLMVRGLDGSRFASRVGCSKIAEAEAAVSVNEKKWLVMHMHVQLQLDELRGPQTVGSL
jgi:hypothetical protein